MKSDAKTPDAKMPDTVIPTGGSWGAESHPLCGPPPLEVEPPHAHALPPRSPAIAGSATPPRSCDAASAIPPFGPPRLEVEPAIPRHLGPHSPVPPAEAARPETGGPPRSAGSD